MSSNCRISRLLRNLVFMIRRRWTLSLALASLLTGALLTGPTPVAAFSSPSVARYVVTFRDGVDAQAQAQAMAGQGMRVVRIYQTLLSGVAADLTPEQAGAIAANPDVVLVEADVVVRTAEAQSGANWALSRIDQETNSPDGAFSYPTTAGSGVVVYVLDTGLDIGTSIRNIQHRDLTGRILPGYSWIDDGEGTDDCEGHGTHVAGTIAGTTHGVAKLATLVPLRVLDCSGWGTTSDVVAALDWIQASRDRSKPAIANLSISGPASQTLDTAVTRLFDAGVTVVSAAGNDSANACSFSPARASAGLTVGSTNSSDYREMFSNYGSCVDIFAPGTFIESASIDANREFTTLGGTSSSAALVSGAAALILGETPTLTSAEVRDRILAQATSGLIGNPGDGSPNRLLRVR